MGTYVTFVKGTSFLDYFTEDQVPSMTTTTMVLALPDTWQHLEHYFRILSHFELYVQIFIIVSSIMYHH